MVHSVITKIAANREHLDFTPKILLSGKSMIFRKKKKKKKTGRGCLLEQEHLLRYRKNSKIWDTSNNCHNCPKNRKV